MGYYVNIVAADFGIPRKKWDAAFEAVAELNEHDELKTGGRWGGGKQAEDIALGNSRHLINATANLIRNPGAVDEMDYDGVLTERSRP